VIGGLTFSQVSASEALTCGTTPAGAGYCWGWNGAGQIGVGDTIGRTSPALVAGGLVFTAVSAGGVQTCGIASGGAAYCWGSNVLGQVGDGTRTNRWTPVAVSGGLTFASLSAGAYHNCGLTTGGAAYCWGSDTIHLTPVPVPGGVPFAAVSAGFSHNCGVTTVGAIYCWGTNFFGELGDGTTNGHVTPMRIADTSLTFAAVGAGYLFTCATTTSGAAYCWGTNEFGELGDGTGGTRRFSATPVLVLGGLTFAEVHTGAHHACGLTKEGTAYCWGFGGLLGNGTQTNSSVPVIVSQ
jgi:alpha-tubulin suppressor-like RCC1 family protein